MPRRLLVVLAVSALVLLVVAAKPILFPAGNPRLTQENFDRIKEGMSREEVEAILGPPGDYCTAPAQIVPSPGSPEPWQVWQRHWDWRSIPTRSSLIWVGDRESITVWFESGKGVFWTDVDLVESEPIGLFDLLRWRWDHWRESRP
jgi:hypothetical protein